MCNCFSGGQSRTCNTFGGNEIREALRTAQASACSAAQAAKEANEAACCAEQIAKSANEAACNARRAAREAANCAKAAQAAAERVRYMAEQQNGDCGCGNLF